MKRWQHLSAAKSREPRKAIRAIIASSRPLQIIRSNRHYLLHCPDCGTHFGKPSEQRTRVIEDIADMEPVVTQHTIPRHWCPKCKKMFEPKVPDALPNATFGHRLVAFSVWLHYGLGATIAQIISVLGHHLRFCLSEGGLVAAWQRLGALLFFAWSEEIGQQIKDAGVLHADETGWRLSGKPEWL